MGTSLERRSGAVPGWVSTRAACEEASSSQARPFLGAWGGGGSRPCERGGGGRLTFGSGATGFGRTGTDGGVGGRVGGGNDALARGTVEPAGGGGSGCRDAEPGAGGSGGKAGFVVATAGTGGGGLNGPIDLAGGGGAGGGGGDGDALPNPVKVFTGPVSAAGGAAGLSAGASISGSESFGLDGAGGGGGGAAEPFNDATPELDGGGGPGGLPSGPMPGAVDCCGSTGGRVGGRGRSTLVTSASLGGASDLPLSPADRSRSRFSTRSSNTPRSDAVSSSIGYGLLLTLTRHKPAARRLLSPRSRRGERPLPLCPVRIIGRCWSYCPGFWEAFQGCDDGRGGRTGEKVRPQPAIGQILLRHSLIAQGPMLR